MSLIFRRTVLEIGLMTRISLSHPAKGGDMGGSPYTAQKGNQGAVRFTFAYKGTSVRLISRQRVQAQPHASDRAYEYAGQAGFWVELRDARDRVLHRHVMHNPIAYDREAPSGDPQRPFTRVAIKEPEGVFTVMVPDLAETHSVHVFASPPSKHAEPAKEVGRFELSQVKEYE
jgi:hypothetical protein